MITLSGYAPPMEVEISLPSCLVTLPVSMAYCEDSCGVAEVIKDAGDDPDVTDGVTVRVMARWTDGNDVAIKGGEGVGLVTKPGLSIQPGMSAINPGPRKMIGDSVREITSRGVELIVSIPGGAEIAKKTFNPRLGIEGGLSILGTTGIVKPFSCEAIRDTLDISLNVARSCGVVAPVLVPGRIGARAATQIFHLKDEQLVEVGNEWGFILERIRSFDFAAIMVIGHAGKLAKLPQGQWDTHSSRSQSAVPFVDRIATSMFAKTFSESLTVEAIFQAMEPHQQKMLAAELSKRIHDAVKTKIASDPAVAVTLVDMSGAILGSFGDHNSWKRR